MTRLGQELVVLVRAGPFRASSAQDPEALRIQGRLPFLVALLKVKGPDPLKLCLEVLHGFSCHLLQTSISRQVHRVRASTNALTIHEDTWHGASARDTKQNVLDLRFHFISKSIQFADSKSDALLFHRLLGFLAKGAPGLGENHDGLQSHHLLHLGFQVSIGLDGCRHGHGATTRQAWSTPLRQCSECSSGGCCSQWRRKAAASRSVGVASNKP
mmetsp:Transcript_5013/g.6231  ORF Transcript_5013/g.6231 Transcript_5013/m.6231 type:complete len:214 (+) Transcript_5013:378-1019(+)